MTSQNSNNENFLDELLDKLLDADDPTRDAILGDIEAKDSTLADRARKLLAYAVGSKDSVAETVDRAAPELFAAFVRQDEDEFLDRQIGAYKIVDVVGRGGMGIVFRAERNDGVYDQTVAIKFAPRLLESKEQRVLFERERAHLARLEHPNIARIIDAGVSDDDAPYYVMEYVDGIRIDNYAKDRPREEQLSLFLQLCEAVAYCHRSLVVHGDIKPGNVLVCDDRVRLLDFGVGRQLDESFDQNDADLCAFSPDYAAPEQIAGAPPTVQSDIYSLGLLLKRISTYSVPADVTAIIEKCCRPSPNDRYRSVDALARDVTAHLDNYPVTARVQTRRYRATRFVQRNKLLVASLATVFIGLGVGLGVAWWQYDSARTEAIRAQQVATFLTSLFERAGPYNSGEQDVTVLQLMDDAAIRVDQAMQDAPEIRTEVKQLIASGYYGIGEYDKSIRIREEALAYWRENRASPDLEIAHALIDLGDEHVVRGEYAEGSALIREAIDQLEALDLGNSVDAVTALSRLGNSLSRTDPAGSLEAMRHAHQLNLIIRPDDKGAIARSLANIAFGLRAVGNDREAAEVSEEALALADANGERLATDIVDARCNLALDYTRLSLGDKARAASWTCIELATERVGPNHPDLVPKYNNLGAMELARGRLDAAEHALETAVRLARETLPETALFRLAAEINFASLLWQSGRPDEAESYAKTALLNIESSLGAGHPASGRMRSMLGRIKLAQNDIDTATQLLRDSIDGLTGVWQTEALLWLAEARLAVGAKEEAARLARESLAVRQGLDGGYGWQTAEIEMILAASTDDEEGLRKARFVLDRDLPENHVRRN